MGFRGGPWARMMIPVQTPAMDWPACWPAALGDTDVVVVHPLALAIAPGGALPRGALPAAGRLVPPTAHTAWRHASKGLQYLSCILERSPLI